MLKVTKSVAKAGRLKTSSPVVIDGKAGRIKRLTFAATGDVERRLSADERRGRLKKRNAAIYQRQKARRKQKREEKKRRLAGSDDPTHARANRTPRLPGIPQKGKLLPKMPSTHVGRLFTVVDWHRQVGKIYREMRRHQIDPGLGTRLTYVANVGATLARFIEESAPPGMETPQDLSRLDDAELAQLEYLMAKAAGPEALERIEQAKPNPDWRRDDE